MSITSFGSTAEQDDTELSERVALSPAFGNIHSQKSWTYYLSTVAL
jgi:hypothetical protein